MREDRPVVALHLISIALHAALATACIDPAKQRRDNRKEEQYGWHQERTNNDQNGNADFNSLPKADKAKAPAQKKIARNLQCDEQVKFEGAGRQEITKRINSKRYRQCQKKPEDET
jgi:hypothetical protein